MSVAEKIRQVLAQEDTVLFVGSGVSQWSGVPSWPRLIEELALYIEATGANAELVRAEARRDAWGKSPYIGKSLPSSRTTKTKGKPSQLSRCPTGAGTRALARDGLASSITS
jgi:hypothetical protein